LNRRGRGVPAKLGRCRNWEIMRFAEPDPELVERAIVKVLEIAQLQGITAADFIQMLHSGMRIPDFLDAVGVFTNSHIGDCDTAN
jgi:hypothetical protein